MTFQSGYTPAKRRQEKVFISVFIVVQLWCVYCLYLRVWTREPGTISSTLIGCLSGAPSLSLVRTHTDMLQAGAASADFLSGLFHWIADTWGDLGTPIIGKTFIRSFREHHVCPAVCDGSPSFAATLHCAQNMCKHDWIETNGDTCLAASAAIALTLSSVRHAISEGPSSSNSFGTQLEVAT